MRRLALRLMTLMLMPTVPATAALTERDLARAVARPPARALLPGALRFTDQRGRKLTLAQAAGGEPLVLLFVDYTCRHVCGPGLTLTAGALQDSGLVAGRDYRLATIGIDPADRLADARAMALRLAATPQVARAASLLSGDARTIAAATRALGYGYVADPASGQFAHDASVYVFAADGRLAALLPELALMPATLRAAVGGSGQLRPAPSGLAERVAHLCYGFGAAHGSYGRPVLLALQAMAALLIAGAALAAWRLRRRPA